MLSSVLLMTKRLLRYQDENVQRKFYTQKSNKPLQKEKKNDFLSEYIALSIFNANCLRTSLETNF